MKENIKLYAVYLGGRADGCNTELHDVVESKYSEYIPYFCMDNEILTK